ncbi:aldo/keto reductase [Candidatus Poribacteria bacterium]|nr:aldo/keto reductase [Candidatus Poribacteria bacterium]
MQKRIFGKTGLEVSIIGFGAIKLPGISKDEAVKIINRALDLGINYIDTARNYRDSEEKVGEVLKDRRNECYVATKSTARDASGLTKDLETSLRNLQTDKIDVYQLHTVSDGDTYKKVMAQGGALEAAKKAKAQGKVDHIGITIHRDLDTMRAAIKSNEFETLMVAYSPLDQEGVEEEIIPMAKEKNMGVVIMKPLSGGLLCLPEPEREKLGKDPIVVGSLRYVVSNPNVTLAIPGMQRMREVEENVTVGNMPKLTDEEVTELLKSLGSMKKEYRYGQVCLRCGYCQPCPQGVVAPTIFRAVDMYKNYPDNLKHLGIELYSSLEIKADDCVECEQCLEKCPAGINIPVRLKQASELFANI